MKPSDWIAWNERFVVMVDAKQLWEYIDPESEERGQFCKKPRKPVSLDYP